MITILLVDEHQIVRAGVANILADEEDLLVVSDVGSGEEAINQVAKYKPQVALIDIFMTGMGGIETIRRITRSNHLIRVIAYTAKDCDPLPDCMLDMGASGYVTKQDPPEEFIRAIRTVNHGQTYVSQSVAERITIQSFAKNALPNPFRLLTNRELQIMLMIIDCQTVAQISKYLLLSPKTVNGYRYSIFKKINISSNLELAMMAIKYDLAHGDLIQSGLPISSLQNSLYPDKLFANRGTVTSL